MGFAADDKYRCGKQMRYVDAYHSANRYASSDKKFVIVLPRTTAWSFDRQRLVLGREMLRIQGMSFADNILDHFTESQLGDLAGNSPPGC